MSALDTPTTQAPLSRRAILARRIIAVLCALFFGYVGWALTTAPPADQSVAYPAVAQDLMIVAVEPMATETTVSDLKAAHFKPTGKPEIAMDITAPLWDAAFERVYGPAKAAKKRKDVVYDLQPVEDIVFGALGHDIELSDYRAYQTATHPGFKVYVNVETGRVMLVTQAIKPGGRIAYLSAENIGPQMLLNSVPEQLKLRGANAKPGSTFPVTTAYGAKRQVGTAPAIVGRFAEN